MEPELRRKYLESCYEELSRIQDKPHITIVRHKETGELRVKKVLNKYDGKLYERLMQLSPEGIPEIYEYADTGDELLLIEEFVNGRTLDAILREKETMDREEVCAVFMQAAGILQKLHALAPPIIHRDIKPSNLMLTKAGNLYLIDFNAAREYDASADEDTRMMGTMDFAAPEQYGFGQSGIRTDQYGLGITLNVLLTGELPRHHLTEDSIFQPLIRRMTEMDPEKRFADLGEALREFQRLQRAEHSVFGKLGRRLSDGWRSTVKAQDGISCPKHSYDGTWRRFLPVGFRTGKLWRMIAAGIWYAYLVKLYFFTELAAEDTPARIFSFCMYLLNIHYVGNYLGIRYRLPGLRRSRWLHILLNILYLVIWNMVMIALFVLVRMFVRGELT